MLRWVRCADLFNSIILLTPWSHSYLVAQCPRSSECFGLLGAVLSDAGTHRAAGHLKKEVVVSALHVEIEQ